MLFLIKTYRLVMNKSMICGLNMHPKSLDVAAKKIPHQHLSGFHQPFVSTWRQWEFGTVRWRGSSNFWAADFVTWISRKLPERSWKYRDWWLPVKPCQAHFDPAPLSLPWRPTTCRLHKPMRPPETPEMRSRCCLAKITSWRFRFRLKFQQVNHL